MSPSANDSNRRRPDRRGDRPAMGSGNPRDFSSRGRPGRGLSDPRRPGTGSFRRLRPRPDGEGEGEAGRWSRDRREARNPETWREPRQWRPTKRDEGRDEGSPRPLRPQRRDRPPAETEAPQGESHAGAAPSELLWGRHAALAALESGRPIHRIWCTPEMRFRPTFLQLLREAKASGVLVEEVTWARLGQISGGAVHQGIVLQPAASDTLDLPSLIEGCRGIGESPLLVAVDGLTDPQNLGAILRSAEALGVHGLVLPQRRNAGLTGSVAKVAAGALEHLPVARVVNLNRALDTLRKEGYRVVGLDPKGSVSLEEADLEGPLVVITGSEGQGLSLLTRRSCDQLVRIPLRGATPSLNASVATALVLYEAARRGWMHGLHGMAPPPRLVRPLMPTQPLEPAGPPLEPEDLRGDQAQEDQISLEQLTADVQEEPQQEPTAEAPSPSPSAEAPSTAPHAEEDSQPAAPPPPPAADPGPSPAQEFAADIHL